MSRVRVKLARVVSTYLPLSSSLSEKAMAWTTKSSRSQRAASAAKVRLRLDSSVTSQSMRESLPIPSASGRTRLPRASP